MAEKLLDVPYLPKGRVRLYVGSVRLPGATGIEPFRSPRLPENLRRHADLTLCYLGRGRAVCSPDSFPYYDKLLPGITLKRGITELDRHYPGDSAYNVCIVGGKVFCKIKITDPCLLDEAHKLGYEIYDINQGYAKCSVCPVSENAAISADASFLRAARAAGVDCLEVSQDFVRLSGYPNGFFGGAAFLSDEKTLSINGSLDMCPETDRIKSFLSRFNIGVSSCGAGAVTDFGSLIALTHE